MRGRRKASESRAGFIRDRIISAMNTRRSFKLLEITGDAQATRTNVQKFVATAIARGLVRRTVAHVPTRGHHGAALYEIMRPIPTLAEMHQPIAREQIWRSIRILRRFTIRSLAATAEASEVNVRKYLAALSAAGYVRRVSNPQPTRFETAAFVLARDTGPCAPKREAGGGIFDPNLPPLDAKEAC